MSQGSKGTNVFVGLGPGNPKAKYEELAFAIVLGANKGSASVYELGGFV